MRSGWKESVKSGRAAQTPPLQISGRTAPYELPAAQRHGPFMLPYTNAARRAGICAVSLFRGIYEGPGEDRRGIVRFRKDHAALGRFRRVSEMLCDRHKRPPNLSLAVSLPAGTQDERRILCGKSHDVARSLLVNCGVCEAAPFLNGEDRSGRFAPFRRKSSKCIIWRRACQGTLPEGKKPAGPHGDRRALVYSNSMVAGGLLVMS